MSSDNLGEVDPTTAEKPSTVAKENNEGKKGKTKIKKSKPANKVDRTSSKDKKEDGPGLTFENQSVFNVIEQETNNINDVGHAIWRYAETPGKEFQSCKRIVDFLKHKGFRIKNVCNSFDTAFCAQFGEGNIEGSPHPNIAFLCQYDADPSHGHCRGNNLQTATTIAAAIGLQRVIGFSKIPLGIVTVIGCPASASKTVKRVMLERQCFNGIDILIIAMPANFTCLQPSFNAAFKTKVTFQGRKLSPGTHDWELANPVNAVVLTQQALAAHRHCFAHDWRINGVIPHAGNDPCSIPDTATMIYELKAPTVKGVQVLYEKLQLCLDGASTASGCKQNQTTMGQVMIPNVKSPIFNQFYRKNGKINGFTFHNEQDVLMDPDDVSFLTQFIPTFAMYYYAGTGAPLGSDEFNRYAGSPEAEYMNIVQGKTLAMMACDLLLDKETRESIQDAHDERAMEVSIESFEEEIKRHQQQSSQVERES